MKPVRFALFALCAAALLYGQEDRDFLTPNEVDQVREAQEPNDRLLLYVHFAKQRMDLLEQYLAKEKPGRSIFVHDTLQDYSHIIEAIDSVSDDALRHNHPIDKGTIAVLNAEREFLAELNKVQNAAPPDLDRYQFVLQEAIDTTNDSRELSLEDSKSRGTELATRDAKEKQAREAVMSTSEVKDRKKAAQAEENKQKKIPSLYRPGEKHPDQQQ